MSAKSDIVKKVAVKFSDTEYVINRHKDGAISVLQDGESCDNAKNALRTINQEKDLGLADEQFKSSNTRSIGKQIMDLLEEDHDDDSSNATVDNIDSGSEMSDEEKEDFKDQEKNAEDFYDYFSLADDISQGGDKQWAKDLYKKAQKLAEDCSEFSELASSIANKDYLGDKIWAKELFEIAKKSANDSSDLRQIADYVADNDYLGDKDWARAIYKNAEDIAENFNDYENLSKSVSYDHTLNDKKWGEKIYNGALEKVQSSDDYLSAGIWTFQRNPKDKDIVKKYFHKAIDIADNKWEIKGIADIIMDEDLLNDKDWARKLYKDILDNPDDWFDSGNYCEIANTIADSFGDKKWAIEIFEIAKQKAMDDDLADEVAFIVEKISELNQIRREDNMSNDNNNSDNLCHNCNSEIHYIWGDISADTYRAYTIDKDGNRLDETEILPRLDRADRIEDESYYMCSNGDCMCAWDTKEEMFNRGKD
jgi:hypothetical protein